MGHMYFVRHGQTVWNVENKICGSTDIDLTEKGHEQAVETGKKILSENIKADIILYSPLMRAHFGNHGNSCKSRAEINRAKLWKI